MRHFTLGPRTFPRNATSNLPSYREADRIELAPPSRTHRMKAPLATEMLFIKLQYLETR